MNKKKEELLNKLKQLEEEFNTQVADIEKQIEECDKKVFEPKIGEEYLDKLKDTLYTGTVIPKQFFEGYKPQYYFKTDNNKICENCSCNPKNGGSGNCNCTLATPTIY